MTEPLSAAECRHRVRRDLGPTAAKGLPAAGALRAVRHHVPRHDRRSARPSRVARAASANPAGPVASCRRSAPTTSSTPIGPGFHAHVATLGELTGADTHDWSGYLDALRSRRAAFVAAGATASDHGHPSPATADLSRREAEALFGRIMAGTGRPGDAELFRGQMLVEMAAMSIDDGLALQIHAGAWRDHNPTGRRPLRARPGGGHPAGRSTTSAASNRSSTASGTSPD